MQSLVGSSDLEIAVPGLVIIDPARSGERNMAIDEALLQNATPQWPVVLRVYRWDRPTLSIGHFQRIEDRQCEPRLRDLPWVRRKTGGGAIVHDQELTYSILLPNRDAKATKGHSESLYRAIHLAFAENLKKLGWNAALSETCTCGKTSRGEQEAFLCFLRRSPVDLMVGCDKILGSAQRRSASGLIQHGSFLLRRAESTPDLSGLLDVADWKRSLGSLSRTNMDGTAGQRVPISIKGSDFDDHIDPWIEFSVASLKLGVSQLLQVNWRNGKVSDLL